MDILTSFTDYIESARTIKLAHLLKMELPGGGAVYMTDYFRDITYDGQIYEAGTLKDIGTVKQTKLFNTYSLSVKFSGVMDTELVRVLDSGVYLRRNITIHRAYLDDNGDIIPMYIDGSTLLYFSGNITKVNLSDSASVNGKGTSTITWTCNNEFADFSKVNGRLTSDDAHRGLVAIEGFDTLQPSAAAKKAEYQTDLGFFHSNKSVTVLAQYQAEETRYKANIDKTWYGSVSGVNIVSYTTLVDREIDLRYDLTAKYIPVVYGVRKVTGLPIFVDTLDNDPNEVYVVYAFCEGEIEGFLDFHIDDNPSVCWDSNIDPEARVCTGTKKTLGQTMHSVATSTSVGPTTDRQTYIIDDGDGPIEITVYHGSSDQAASGILTALAATNSFYLQQNPPDGSDPIDGEDYWGSAFQLRDTAYAVCKFNLSEDRSDIPDIAAEVLGKKVYTYDSDGLPIDNSKTSINPAWQILDYIQSSTYGGELTVDAIDTKSFYDVAQLCNIEDTSYEESWVSYWRYVGWDENENSGANRGILQCNTSLSTEETVFKNIDSMLQQIDASLNVNNGVYSLTMLADLSPIADINTDSAVGGSVELSDSSINTRYNSVQASIVDPGTQWATNQITFFNSDYKEEDNNETRNGNYKFPFITNYYTARSAAERFLKASRSTRKVTITLSFRYAYLQVNDHFTITSDRYSWDAKRFIVEQLEWTKDARIKVTGTEYIDGMFVNSVQVDVTADLIPDISNNVLPARDLQFTPYIGDTLVGKVGELSWLPSITSKISYYLVTWTGLAENVVIAVDPSAPITDRIVYEVQDLEVGTYDFSVRAVDYRGKASKAVILSDITVDPILVLEAVEGLEALNASTINPGSWTGPGLQLSWDEYSGSIAGYTNFGYNLVIKEADAPYTSLQDLFIPYGTTTYNYTLTTNKADHLAATLATGVYRNLTVKIRAVADGGVASATWSYL